MSSDTIIEFSGVWKKYSKRETFHRSLREDIGNFFRVNGGHKLRDDEFWALRDLNLSVGRGECVGLFGPNGAGKSTILKLIASVTYPTVGRVMIDGRVAPLIEVGAGFHPDLTGRENVFMNGTIIGMSIKEIKHKLDAIIDFSELEGFIDMPVKKYSSGMHLRLGFAIAVHSSADILLIDEILAVGDEAFRNKCIEKTLQVRKRGRTVVAVSHDKTTLDMLTDRVLHLRKGERTDEVASAEG